MSITWKNIGLIFIGLAGLVIMAHGVVPHHHHYDSIYAHTDDNPCTAAHKHERKENKKQHCHAFNESKVDRVKHFKINFQTVARFFEVIFVLPEFSGTSKSSYFEYHFTNNIYPYFLFIYTEFPLRAPPTLN